MLLQPIVSHDSTLHISQISRRQYIALTYPFLYLHQSVPPSSSLTMLPPDLHVRFQEAGLYGLVFHSFSMNLALACRPPAGKGSLQGRGSGCCRLGHGISTLGGGHHYLWERSELIEIWEDFWWSLNSKPLKSEPRNDRTLAKRLTQTCPWMSRGPVRWASGVSAGLCTERGSTVWTSWRV